MANPKKGQFISHTEWAKHLRSNRFKKGFWKQENVRLRSELKKMKENGNIRFV